MAPIFFDRGQTVAAQRSVEPSVEFFDLDVGQGFGVGSNGHPLLVSVVRGSRHWAGVVESEVALGAVHMVGGSCPGHQFAPGLAFRLRPETQGSRHSHRLEFDDADIPFCQVISSSLRSASRLTLHVGNPSLRRLIAAWRRSFDHRRFVPGYGRGFGRSFGARTSRYPPSRTRPSAWWAPRSSKPVGGRKVPGGFDSRPPPPTFLTWGNRPASDFYEAVPSGQESDPVPTRCHKPM